MTSTMTLVKIDQPSAVTPVGSRRDDLRGAERRFGPHLGGEAVRVLDDGRDARTQASPIQAAASSMSSKTLRILASQPGPTRRISQPRLTGWRHGRAIYG